MATSKIEATKRDKALREYEFRNLLVKLNKRKEIKEAQLAALITTIEYVEANPEVVHNLPALLQADYNPPTEVERY